VHALLCKNLQAAEAVTVAKRRWHSHHRGDDDHGRSHHDRDDD
jgi:hypothetical protein